MAQTQRSSNRLAKAGVDEQTLLALRERVAFSIARRSIKTAQLTHDGVRIGVDFVLSRGSDHGQCEARLVQVARKIHQILVLNSGGNQEYTDGDPKGNRSREGFLFALARSPPHREKDAWPLVLVASSGRLLRTATALASAKFLGRLTVKSHENEENFETDSDENDIDEDTHAHTWLAHVADIGKTEHDSALLWYIVQNTPHAVQPASPPPGALSTVQLVARARTRLGRRLSPADAMREFKDASSPHPVVLVDIRSAAQRTMHGIVPHAMHVERVELELAFDFCSEIRLPVVDRYDLRVIVFDQDGLVSSLAAATLHDLGLLNATDIRGGFAAWKAAGLPITHE